MDLPVQPPVDSQDLIGNLAPDVKARLAQYRRALDQMSEHEPDARETRR